MVRKTREREQPRTPDKQYSLIDLYSCACNDRCPVCDLEIEPEDYVDLTAVIGFDEKTEKWIVSLSPSDAEDDPGYRPTRFKERAEADAFLASSLGA